MSFIPMTRMHNKFSLKEATPFLEKWIWEKLRQIESMPAKPERKGLRRKQPGETFPLSGKKTLFALFKNLMRTLGMTTKQLAEINDLSYGTARNWAIERKVQNRIEAFALEFADRFLTEYLARSAMEGSVTTDDQATEVADQIFSLLQEACLYQGQILQALLKRLHELILSEPDKQIKYRLLVLSEYILRNGNAHLEMAGEFFTLINLARFQLMDDMLEELRGKVKDGKVADALKDLDIIKDALDELKIVNNTERDFWKEKK